MFLIVLNCCCLQLDGRVKTLHPSIHGGILARRDHNHHMEALNAHGIGMYQSLYHRQYVVIFGYFNFWRYSTFFLFI